MLFFFAVFQRFNYIWGVLINKPAIMKPLTLTLFYVLSLIITTPSQKIISRRKSVTLFLSVSFPEMVRILTYLCGIVQLLLAAIQALLTITTYSKSSPCRKRCWPFDDPEARKKNLTPLYLRNSF